MPIAVVLPENTPPAILEEATETALFDAVCALAATPDAAKESPEALRAWLDTLPPPSGWFASVEDAAAYKKKSQFARDSRLLATARKQLGYTQREMTGALGLVDNDGQGVPVRRIEKRKQGLSGPSRRALAYALKYGAMTVQEEREILNQVGNGAWRDIKKADVLA
jgi:hypothetical protein